MLHFERVGFERERDHLEELSDKVESKLTENIKKMKEAGKSIRETSVALGVSYSRVQRTLKGLGF